jgi:hypothetical protein
MCMCVAAIARSAGNIRGVHGGKVAARPQWRSFVLAEEKTWISRGGAEGAEDAAFLSWFIVAARRASAGGEPTTRDTVSRTSAVAGCTKLPLGLAATADGSKRGRGPSAFFDHPILFQSATRPAIRLHLIMMRDLVNRRLARPRRERAGHLAHRDFERSRSRCSWRLGPVRLRQASPPADVEHDRALRRHRCLPQKTRMAPHCVRTIRPTRRSTPDIQPETGKRSTCYGNAAGRGLNSVVAPSPGSPATQSMMNLFLLRALRVSA